MSFEIPAMENLTESKRIYRCPNCDVIVLEKQYFNSTHNCSCGVHTHTNNLKLEFEVA